MRKSNQKMVETHIVKKKITKKEISEKDNNVQKFLVRSNLIKLRINLDRAYSSYCRGE